MTEPLRHVQTTHEVVNQALPLEDHDAFASDVPFQEAVAREGDSWIAEALSAYGRVVGTSETARLAAQANRYVPELRSHDRFGHRIDEVEYHPAYHELMRRAMAHEVHSVTWRNPRPGAHVAHAALLYLHAQAEPGTCCPLTMTHACVPTLRVEPELAREWEPRVLGTEYDPRSLPAAAKTSATIGMAMTEKQGGSDVRANSTRARAAGRHGTLEAYELTGHKWFCSAPMSDAFLTLAQTERGLTCFFVPRWLPDGAKNRFFIQRLKDKLGNRANASSEIEYDRTWAVRVGEEGRGVPAIIQMVAQTRVDCAAGSAGLMRHALTEAIHHARQRSAFGRLLVDQPLMLRVLADLALELEGALALAFRVARCYDSAASEEERALARVATPVAKYWITRRTPPFAFEAMECLGGAGYVEESVLPRIYREGPVNSIWEGSGNVQCLDVLRALEKQSRSLDALLLELGQARGANRHLDAHVDRLKGAFSDPSGFEANARKLAEDVALGLSASVLVRHAPPAVADAYCATRLGGQRGFEYGTIPAAVDARALVARTLPES
ncbi:MAG TPA: isovaleryl-CoA dehydrogenase [Polyangiaceae bacterium]|nr:isovaleryl-CoA dehydrogenase [Polyangiaceae bacterium]